MKLNKGIKKFFIVIGKIVLYLILTVYVMALAGMFARWSLAVTLMSNFWYLVYVYPFIIVGGFILGLNKKLREKTRKVFLNLFRKSYKIGRLLVPKNKITRLVFNIGFVVVWFLCLSFITRFLENLDNRFTVYAGSPQEYLLLALFFGGILFITQFLWLPNGFRDIANTFVKAGLSKKEIKRRFESTANYLSKSSKVSSKSRRVQSNISDADEIKKYADLRDKGIITEEEFLAKKKILLDL